MLLSVDGVWQPPVVVDRSAKMRSVSCPASTFCVAVDSHDHAVSYDGTSWSRPELIDPGNGALNSVSCSSTTFCVAVDKSGHAVTFDGSTWAKPVLIDTHAVPRRTTGLTAVSCASRAFCAAVDDAGFATLYSGTTWMQPQAVSEGIRLSSISCTSPTWCIAGGIGIYAYNGSDWTFQHSPNGSTAQKCLVRHETRLTAIGMHRTIVQLVPVEQEHFFTRIGTPTPEGEQAPEYWFISRLSALSPGTSKAHHRPSSQQRMKRQVEASHALLSSRQQTKPNPGGDASA